MTTLFSNGYAIFIGVGADLPVTTKDAQALRDLFIHPERAAYSPGRVELLIDKDATRKGILTTLDTFAMLLSKDPNATMIVYFSGHGGYFSQAAGAKEYFLLPNDYDAKRRENTTISGDVFTKKIEALYAKRLIILLDCCHAGGMSGAKGVGETFEKAPIPPTLLRVLETGSGQGIIASSLEAEKSYYDSSHSIFTSCLLDALSGKGAQKNDGFARFLDVILYLFDEVPKRALPYGPQHPFINKIQGVSENFPLCFVDGGSKAIPFQEERLASKSNLSSGKRQRLEEEKSRLLEEREQQILGPESRLAALDTRLDELEELFALSGVKDKEFPPVSDDQKSPSEVSEASPHKENSSAMLLTELEQQKLVDLLCKIPTIEYATVRHSFVSGLPAYFQTNIDFDKSCVDYVAEIIVMVTRDTTFQLPNGAFPIMVVIQNAMKRVTEQSLKLELQYFLNTLQSRWGVIQDKNPQPETLETFVQEFHNFMLQLPAVKYDLMRIYDYFDDYISDPACENMYTYLTEVCRIIPSFYNSLKQYHDPEATSYRIRLTGVLQDFDLLAKKIEDVIDRFCIKYGSVIAEDQPEEEREKIQQLLLKLSRQMFDKVLDQVQILYGELVGD